MLRIQLSISDLFVLIATAAVLAFVNLLQRDVGSGITIVEQGWPMAVAIIHPIHGMVIHWPSIWANLATAVVAMVVAVLILRTLRHMLLLASGRKS
ncbi:MAG: hypothetical protein AAF483_19260 [Planctomycetota bacterium]